MSGAGTDYTLTPNLGLFKPIANAAVGLWGDLLNTNADTIDSAIHASTGGGPYLPLAGNATVFGATTFSNTLTLGTSLIWGATTATGFGTGVGQIPVFANYQGSGFANLAFPTRLIISKSGGTTANDFASVNIIRTTTHSGGAGGLVATGLRVNTIAGQGVTNQEWAVLGVAQSSSTVPGGAIVGGDFQGIRLANSPTPIWGGIFNAVDQCGTSSSVTAGAVLGGEVDIRSSGTDTGSNPGMFGGKGLRVCLQTVIHRQDTTVPLEVSHGHWFSTDELTTNKLYSAIGFVVGMQVHQALDTRGAVSPDANPHAAVRMLHDQIIDFNGGTALNSAPGSYLQYTTSGTSRLRYMAGANEVWSVSNAGAMSASWIATGSITLRSAQDRSADTVNALDYGVLLDGSTNNTAFLNAARVAAKHNGSVFVPAGLIHGPLTTTSGPTTAVLWKLDGTTFPDGTTPITQMGAPGDTVEAYYNGYKYFAKQQNPVGAFAPVVRIDLTQNLTGSGGGGIAYALNVNATQNAGDESLVYALAVLGTSSADASSLGMAGIQSTVIKQGGGQVWAIQTVSRDDTGLASSANGRGLLGAEIAIRATNVDDATNLGSWGNVGNRKAVHISLTRTVGAPDVESGFSHAIWISGDNTATKSYISSVYGVDTFVDTYQVFDARGAGAPFNYGSNPVAALRMAAGQVVDFNGGPALNSVAGAYLQYRTATSRLYYVVAGVDMWSVDASGNVRAKGTLTGSTTP